MDSKIHKLLLPFYFGTVSEQERLWLERELISDPEVLIDYLDIKRKVEDASMIPAKPSYHLIERIQRTGFNKKTLWISFSMGAAIAAGLALLIFFKSAQSPSELTLPNTNNALFDSSSELSVSSGVL